MGFLPYLGFLTSRVQKNDFHMYWHLISFGSLCFLFSEVTSTLWCKLSCKWVTVEESLMLSGVLSGPASYVLSAKPTGSRMRTVNPLVSTRFPLLLLTPLYLFLRLHWIPKIPKACSSRSKFWRRSCTGPLRFLSKAVHVPPLTFLKRRYAYRL